MDLNECREMLRLAAESGAEIYPNSLHEYLRWSTDMLERLSIHAREVEKENRRLVDQVAELKSENERLLREKNNLHRWYEEARTDFLREGDRVIALKIERSLLVAVAEAADEVSRANSLGKMSPPPLNTMFFALKAWRAAQKETT